MKEQNDIWIGEKDLSKDEQFVAESGKEFNEYLPIVDSFGDNRSLEVHTSRRDFLKYLGFGLGAATVAASCEIPLKRAIPYVIKPEEIVPGVATYYASSFVQGGDYCSVLVKTREGRPIKIEGNEMSPVTAGGTSARAQASVLSLYDVNRIKSPMKNGGSGNWEKAEWADIDTAIAAGLSPASRIRILTHTVMSPSLKRAMDEFTATFPNTQVITYDPVSSAALLKANEESFGVRAIADYHFDKAEVVVGIQADFLGTWISPVEYARDYIQGRKIVDTHNVKMSRHFQIESYMSLTGSNADNRIQVRPSEIGAAIAHLYNAVAGKVGQSTVSAPEIDTKARGAIGKLADQLVAKRGKSLVVCGTNNPGEQVFVNAINSMLGNIGQTMDFNRASMQRQGDETGMTALIAEMRDGQVDAVFVHGANPVYEHPQGAAFAEALANVETSVSFGGLMDETSANCAWLAPDHHYLESWGDAEPKRGQYSLIQPTISPLFNTRQAGHSLLLWANSASLDATEEQPYYAFVRNTWETNIFPQASGAGSFRSFWDKSLHNGVVETTVADQSTAFAGNVQAAASRITRPSSSELEITFFESVNIGAGQYANNPWLMEMPDPVTRTAWGNYLAIPLNFDGVRKFAGLNDLEDGDVAELTINQTSVETPVVKQFGQKDGTIAMALGYGRTEAGRVGTNVGANVMPWLQTDSEGYVQYFAVDAALSGKLAKEKHYSSVQYHHTMGVQAEDKKTGEIINADEAALVYNTMGGLVDQGYQGALVNRTVIRRSHVDDLEKFIHDLQHEREHHQYLNAQSLYAGYDEQYATGHHWGMHVDLNACIGCAACTVACMSENNVPIVGKKEVSRHHEMTWLRIDRYYYGDAENPNVVYQPLMCQHCDNAPCENVCPVNATNHSSEGLNQMAYNRCVGTRYCANNCPYKVRRFNWLDFNSADLWPINESNLKSGEDEAFYTDNLTRMVLNPDVTVRSRGVIEKCSFCVQRIQEGKLRAKTEGRTLIDADVRTACQTACPTGAITFGDQNNKKGELSAKFESPLNYIVLEEVNTRPSVVYTSKVNNRDNSLEA